MQGKLLHPKETQQLLDVIPFVSQHTHCTVCQCKSIIVNCCTDLQSAQGTITKFGLVFGNGTKLPNRTMIPANDIGRSPMTALWCQSPSNDSDTGTWLLPNGTALATTPTAPLYIVHDIGRVGLFVDENQDFISIYQGVFRCIIPDENNINRTLMVWIYNDYIFNREGTYTTYYWYKV